MNATRDALARAMRTLFVGVFAAFLATGLVLVLTQIVGLVITSPTAVTWAAETLTAPAVILASVAGVIAFAHTYINRSDSPIEEG